MMDIYNVSVFVLVRNARCSLPRDIVIFSETIILIEPKTMHE